MPQVELWSESRPILRFWAHLHDNDLVFLLPTICNQYPNQKRKNASPCIPFISQCQLRVDSFGAVYQPPGVKQTSGWKKTCVKQHGSGCLSPKTKWAWAEPCTVFKGLISQSLSVIPPCSQHMSSDAALPASEPQLWTAPVVGLGDLAARCRSKIGHMIFYTIISIRTAGGGIIPGPLHIIILSSHNLSI